MENENLYVVKKEEEKKEGGGFFVKTRRNGQAISSLNSSDFSTSRVDFVGWIQKKKKKKKEEEE